MQLLTDLKNAVNSGQSPAPASQNASFNGASVDLQNSDVRTHAIVDNGAVVGNAIWTVQMQGSLDGSTGWTNEPDAGALSGNISAQGLTYLSYQRTFRYQRSAFTLVSGTSSTVGCLILSEKKEEPANAGYDRSPST